MERKLLILLCSLILIISASCSPLPEPYPKGLTPTITVTPTGVPTIDITLTPSATVKPSDTPVPSTTTTKEIPTFEPSATQARIATPRPVIPQPTATQSPKEIVLPSPTKVPPTNTPIPPTPGPKWPTGDPYIQCDRVNVSLFNDSYSVVNTNRVMKDKDGNIVGSNTDPIAPGQYANLGWSGNPPPGYVGPVSWAISFYDPANNALLHTYDGSGNLNCPAPVQAPKWPIGNPYIQCDRANVSLFNDSQMTVNSFREMKDKDGNVVGANYDPVPPGQYANLGWSGNPSKGYTGSVSWIITFTDPSNGAVLHSYADSATLNCP